jgi:hypothetical protein
LVVESRFIADACHGSKIGFKISAKITGKIVASITPKNDAA